MAAAAFLDDLRDALRAWRAAPWLPVISMLLGSSVWGLGTQRLLTSADPEATVTAGESTRLLTATVILLAVGIAQLGWYGTLREVYRRVWDEEADAATDLLATTAGYVGRFLRLGVIAGAPLVVATLWLGDAAGPRSAVADVVSLVLTAGLYVVLTFVVPELAFARTRATAALAAGVSLLREHRRTVVWHAVLPPLLLATLRALTATLALSEVGRVLVGAVSSLVGLATAGAIARRWLVLRGRGAVQAIPRGAQA